MPVVGGEEKRSPAVRLGLVHVRPDADQLQTLIGNKGMDNIFLSFRI